MTEPDQPDQDDSTAATTQPVLTACPKCGAGSVEACLDLKRCIINSEASLTDEHIAWALAEIRRIEAR